MKWFFTYPEARNYKKELEAEDFECGEIEQSPDGYGFVVHD